MERVSRAFMENITSRNRLKKAIPFAVAVFVLAISIITISNIAAESLDHHPRLPPYMNKNISIAKPDPHFYTFGIRSEYNHEKPYSVDEPISFSVAKDVTECGDFFDAKILTRDKKTILWQQKIVDFCGVESKNENYTFTVAFPMGNKPIVIGKAGDYIILIDSRDYGPLETMISIK